MPKVRHDHSRFDLISPSCILALATIGIFFIYSAQNFNGGSAWKSQIVWFILGVIAYNVVSFIDYKIMLKYSHLIYAGAILLLAMVLWSPLGVEKQGAKRWLNLGYDVQPVEVAKLSCIIIGASILTRSEVGSVRDSLQVLGKMALAIFIPFLLILLQPDLGSAMVIPFIVFAQLYASNLSKTFFATSILLFAVFVGIIAIDTFKYSEFLEKEGLQPIQARGQYEPHSWVPLEDYQRERVLGFLNPGKVDAQGIGWNREQSVISVASGSLFGKGWTNGYQAQLGYLPRSVAHNDFIFSVIAEETGFLGSVVVLSLFGLLIGNSIRIASTARDRFGTLLALGVATLFSVHIFVNIAMTIGMMPITGLPLPFLSHGGTFMVSCCILQGIAQSVYRFRKDF